MTDARIRISLSMLFSLAIWAVGLVAQISEGKGRIEGVLVDQVTRQPVRRASLALRPLSESSGATASGIHRSQQSVISGVDGTFVIDQIEPGLYTLTADPPGYVAGAYWADGSNVLTVFPGQTIADIRFEVTPHGAISGRVIDEDGYPMMGVRVTALRSARLRGRRIVQPAVAPVAVDEQGRFRIPNLPPGRYTLSAHITQRLASDAQGASYVTTFFPNAMDLPEAAPVTVNAGSEENATIQMQKHRVFRLAGQIVDLASGAPIQDPLFLTLRHEGDDDQSPPVSSLFSKDGSFEFKGIRPGSYTIEPRGTNFRSLDTGETILAKYCGSYPVRVTDRDLINLAVPFGMGLTIAGVITTEDGGQWPLPSPGTGSQVDVQPIVQLLAEHIGARDFRARSQKDGTFVLSGVWPERFRVHVTGLPKGSFVKSVRFGGDDITDEVLDLTSGASAPLRIVISPRAASVTGVVHNDNGGNMAGILVTCAPKSRALGGQWHLFRHARTNPEGRFIFNDLAPGDYQFLAWEDVDINLAMDPEFRAYFDARAVNVTLRESSRGENITLKLVSRHSIIAARARLP